MSPTSLGAPRVANIALVEARSRLMLNAIRRAGMVISLAGHFAVIASLWRRRVAIALAIHEH